MPAPVYKERPSYQDKFLQDMVRDFPSKVAEFEETYTDDPIIGGDCQTCGAHVIEDNDKHKEWHRKLNFAIWLLSDYLINMRHDA